MTTIADRQVQDSGHTAPTTHAKLAQWVEETARGRGSRLVGQTVPANSGPEAFFRSRGYREGWTSWVLQLSPGATIEQQPLPHGYSLREFADGEDGRVAFQLIEDAFNEWPGREPSSYADWAPRGPLRPGFAGVAGCRLPGQRRGGIVTVAVGRHVEHGHQRSQRRRRPWTSRGQSRRRWRTPRHRRKSCRG